MIIFDSRNENKRKEMDDRAGKKMMRDNRIREKGSEHPMI